MEHLEHPSKVSWESRRTWFEDKLLAGEERGGSYLVSEQGCALMAEAQSCFCAGAWIAAILLCCTTIDAQLREAEVPGFKGNNKELLDAVELDARYHTLRVRRNRIIHIKDGEPAITVDQQWGSRVELEREAREAVELAIDAIYLSPGV